MIGLKHSCIGLKREQGHANRKCCQQESLLYNGLHIKRLIVFVCYFLWMTIPRKTEYKKNDRFDKLTRKVISKYYYFNKRKIIFVLLIVFLCFLRPGIQCSAIKI